MRLKEITHIQMHEQRILLVARKVFWEGAFTAKNTKNKQTNKMTFFLVRDTYSNTRELEERLKMS